MPTYEYKCQECGHIFDAFQNMTDDPLSECEKCGGPVKRLIGAGAGIIFKGSGFYCTDYRSDNYQQRSNKEETASKSSGKNNGSSEKPAAEKSTPAQKAETSKGKSDD